MTTPAYIALDDTKPVGTQNALAAMTSSRDNMNALRDMIAGGMLVWDYVKSNGNGTDEQPQFNIYVDPTDTTHWLRAEITWDASGFVTRIVWDWSNDYFATSAAIGYEDYTYTGDNLSLSSWTYGAP